MELHVLMWILGGGFAGTWGLCIMFMMRSDATSNDIRREISEIRREIFELHSCVKDHHSRLSVLESKK